MNRLAVLGHPVAHSRSPQMHNAAFDALGMAGEWHYEAIDVEPDRFAERLAELPGEGFRGVNVTVPHKAEALRLSDQVSARALEIGAANTLSFTEHGIEADNSDAPGFLAAIGPIAAGTEVLVLGAGGTSRAVLWALAAESLGLQVWNRTPERAEEVCRELGGAAIGAGEIDQRRYGLIVNCSAAGLDGGDPFRELPLAPEGFRDGQTVVDMVYGDRPSRLLSVAAAAGAEVVDGLEMLVRQGAISFEIWTGIEPPLEVMRAAVRAA